MISFLPIRVGKELRELFPWWAAAVVGVAVCGFLSRLRPVSLSGAAAVMFYITGSVGLGALSIGHEYSHRTLGVLLAQPVDRRRILATKLAVLLPLLLTLVPLAAFYFSSEKEADHRSIAAASFLALVAIPPTVGLCLAPWLTMACRGALAGTTFAVILPLLVLAIADVYRLSRGEVLEALFLMNAIGAVMTWRAFMRLEAIDGPQAEINLPRWIRRRSIDETAPALVRNRVWLLVQKELHLQQMTLVISALFVAIWFGTLTLRRFVPDFQGPDLFSTSIIHGWFVVIVAGALPSAEERQIGAIAWQALMPMAAWRQWTIKAGVAMTLGFALAIGLPMVLASVAPDGNNFPVDWELVLPASIILASALYVSSLNSSGMRAILATFPTGAGAALILSTVIRSIDATAARHFRPIAEHVTPFAFSAYGDFRYWSRLTSAATLAPLAIGLVWLILAFGLTNHRSADRPASRVRRQLGWIMLYVVLASVLVLGVSELVRAGLQR